MLTVTGKGYRPKYSAFVPSDTRVLTVYKVKGAHLNLPARIANRWRGAMVGANANENMGVSWLLLSPFISAYSAVFIAVSIVFKISLAEMARAIPLHTDLLEWADGHCRLRSPRQFLQLTDDPLYFEASSAIVTNCRYFHTCRSLLATAGVGGGAQQALHAQYIPLLLAILPSWTFFLIRVHAGWAF